MVAVVSRKASQLMAITKVSRAERHANMTGDWRACLEIAQADHQPARMDWLGMEATLRAWVRANKDHEHAREIDEIVAIFSARGWELSQPKEVVP